MTTTDIEDRIAQLARRRGTGAPPPSAPSDDAPQPQTTPRRSVPTAPAAGPLSAPPASGAARSTGVRPVAIGASAADRIQRARTVAAAVVVCLLVAAAVGSLVPHLRSAPERRADPRGMVRVPGGTYLVGQGSRPAARHAEARAVTVADFWIMRDEMSVARLADLTGTASDPVVAAAVRDAPDAAAIGVDLATARRACAAMGGRLPSEAEWEIAGRGPQATRHPWGDGARAGGAPDRSIFGVDDLQGGALELVDRPYAPTPAGTVLVRGGRDLTVRRSVADVGAARAGFRCVADRIESSIAPAVSVVRAPGATVGVGASDVRIAASIAVRRATDRFGLAVRRSARGAYALMIDPGARRWSLERQGPGGRPTVLASGTAPLLAAPAGADALVLGAHGEWIEASVDGVVVARVADRRLGSGDAGVVVESTPRAERRGQVAVADLVVDLAVLDPNTRSS